MKGVLQARHSAYALMDLNEIAHTMVAEADVSGDGVVTFAEFAQIFVFGGSSDEP